MGFVTRHCSVKRVDMSIRWVARLLWTLHLAFGEGFSLAYTQYLNSAYPSHLLPELYESCKVVYLASTCVPYPC